MQADLTRVEQSVLLDFGRSGFEEAESAGGNKNWLEHFFFFYRSSADWEEASTGGGIISVEEKRGEDL